MPNAPGDLELPIGAAHHRRDAVAGHFDMTHFDCEVLVVCEMILRGDDNGDTGGNDGAGGEQFVVRGAKRSCRLPGT